MKHLFSLGAMLFTLSLAAQSPWARSKGGFYVQGSWNFIPTYTTLFGADNKDIVLEREVSEQMAQLYVEYGLTKKTTLTAALPFAFNQRGAHNPDGPYFFEQEDSGRIAGLGNATLALRHQFLRGKLALAGGLRVGLPAATAFKQPGLRTGYPALTLLPSVSAGMGLGKIYWYTYGGYGYRDNDYSHFLHLGGELGVQLGKIWLIGFTETVYPLNNGARRLPTPDVLTGLYVNEQGWVSIGVKALWEINRHIGIHFSGAGAAWAQNVPKSPGIGLGVYCKWGR